MKAALKRAAGLGLLARDLGDLRASRNAGRAEVRHRIVQRLGLLHGLPQKIGQLLASSGLEEAGSAFGTLTEGEPTMSGDEAAERVERLLGRPLSECFRSLDPRGVSASIGQVHRAVLHDGRQVAVKVQYPGISEAVAFDLKALGWLTAPVGDLRRGFDLGGYREEIGRSIGRELDYQAEAGSLARFRELAGTLRRPPELPEAIPEFCGREILTMTWVGGDRLAGASRWTLAERSELSSSLVELFMRGLMDWGLLHADPHCGNYRFLRVEGRPLVGLIDFGCVTELGPRVKAGLSGLVRDALAGQTDVAARLATAGFEASSLSRLRSKLPAVGAILTEPLVSRGPFDARAWNLGARLSEALGPDRMAFRTAGPPGIIFFLRAFQGLIRQLQALDAPVDWKQAADLSLLPHLAAPKEHPVPGAGAERTLAADLRILVTEGGVAKASLTYSAAAADALGELMPQEIRRRMSAAGVDVDAISRGARLRGYPAGELFSLESEGKRVRVWLE
jgi:hypothetical protein